MTERWPVRHGHQNRCLPSNGENLPASSLHRSYHPPPQRCCALWLVHHVAVSAAGRHVGFLTKWPLGWLTAQEGHCPSMHAQACDPTILCSFTPLLHCTARQTLRHLCIAVVARSVCILLLFMPHGPEGCPEERTRLHSQLK